MQWGMDKTVNPYNFGVNINSTWRNLGTVTSTGVWAIPSAYSTFTQAGAGAVTRTTQSKLTEALSVTDYGAITSTNDASAIQNAVNRANQLGGALANLPAGSAAVVTAPVDLKKGSYLTGSIPTIVNDTSAPFLTGSRIAAGANIAAVIKQENSSAGSTHSMGLERLTVDGRRGAYNVTDIVKLSPISSNFLFNNIGNGSGNCVSHVNPTSGDPVWENFYLGNQIGSCNGSALNYQGSDGRIAFNYFSSSSVDLKISGTTGVTQIVGNNIDCAGGGGDGNCLAMSGSPDGDGIQITAPIYNFFLSPIVANSFVHNAHADVTFKNKGSLSRMYVPAVGNAHHFAGSTGTGSFYKWETNVEGGVIVGDTFSYYGLPTKGACDVAFTDATNQYVGIFGTMHDKTPANRFCNLPGDTQFITGGPGGAYNRLQSLILSSTTSAVSAQQTRLQVHGGDEVLGSSGVMARFSNGINSPGYDAALLVGSAFGTTPYLNCVNGETTAVAACWFLFKGTLLMTFDDSGVTFGGLVKDKVYALGSLPTCNTAALGARAAISNGQNYASAAYGTAVGSTTGSSTRQVFCTNATGSTEWAYN